MVPGAGLEPAHGYPYRCLRPTRLPVPPSRHKVCCPIYPTFFSTFWPATFSGFVDIALLCLLNLQSFRLKLYLNKIAHIGQQTFRKTSSCLKVFLVAGEGFEPSTSGL